MGEIISNALKEYGLSDKEIKVFIYLVEKGRTTAYKISKGTKIFKSTCYDVLERLIAKGFISTFSNEKKMIYSARDMTEILGIVKTKEELLISLIPKIKALESNETTFVKHVESENAFLGVNTKISELAKNRNLSYVYMISNNPKITTPSSSLLIRRLVNELLESEVRTKIICRGIWDIKLRGNEFMELFNKLGDNRFIKLPSQSTMIIFDDHVVFFLIEDQTNTIEIKNKKIANEMKAYFEYLWKIAKK